MQCADQVITLLAKQLNDAWATEKENEYKIDGERVHLNLAKVQALYLYGSRAYGSAHEHSDYVSLL